MRNQIYTNLYKDNDIEYTNQRNFYTFWNLWWLILRTLMLLFKFLSSFLSFFTEWIELKHLLPKKAGTTLMLHLFSSSSFTIYSITYNLCNFFSNNRIICLVYFLFANVSFIYLIIHIWSCSYTILNSLNSLILSFYITLPFIFPISASTSPSFPNLLPITLISLLNAPTLAFNFDDTYCTLSCKLVFNSIIYSLNRLSKLLFCCFTKFWIFSSMLFVNALNEAVLWTTFVSCHSSFFIWSFNLYYNFEGSCTRFSDLNEVFFYPSSSY